MVEKDAVGGIHADGVRHHEQPGGFIAEDPTAVHDDDSIGGLGQFAEVMRRHDHGPAAGDDVPDGAAQPVDGVDVQPNGGLIEHDQVWIGQQCDRDSEPLVLAHRQARAPAVSAVREAGAIQGRIGLRRRQPDQAPR